MKLTYEHAYEIGQKLGLSSAKVQQVVDRVLQLPCKEGCGAYLMVICAECDTAQPGDL